MDLFGNVAPVAEIEALGVPVLEDAAQAAGSRLCSPTHAGSGSDAGSSAAADADEPGHRTTRRAGGGGNLLLLPVEEPRRFGDGGMITTSDAAVAEAARTLRFHGSHDKVTYEQVGYNSRLDELQAAILRVQLPHLDAWADGRRAAGRYYEEAGLGELVRLPRPVDGASPAWHLYVVAHPDVQHRESALAAAGSAARPTTALPCTARSRCASGAPGSSCPRPRRPHGRTWRSR